MRALSAGELTTVSGTTFQIATRIKVQNGSGTLKDYSAYVERLVLDQDIDQQAQGATVDFTRDPSATASLAPLREDSTLNVLDDGVTYSPAIDIGRKITIEIATTELGVSPGSGDWKMMFVGYIGEVDWSKPVVNVDCQDQSVQLIERWMDTEYTIAEGTLLEGAIQSLLNAYFTGGDAITLNVPVSPDFPLTAGTIPVQSISDAINFLANLAGWTIGYKWNEDDDEFQLTLYGPDRTKTAPDFTFTPSRYIDVKRLSFNRSEIRNKGRLYFWPASGSAIAYVDYQDDDSIARFGEKLIVINEADDSPIDSSIEAQKMLSGIILDTKDPKAEQEIEAHLFWPVELGDLYRFEANGVHYSVDEDWAVSGIRHELSQGSHRSLLKVRGSPAAGYFTWLNKASSPGTGDEGFVRVFRIVNFREVERSATEITLGWEAGDPVPDQLWLYLVTKTQPVTGDPWADLSGTPYVRLTGDTTEYTVPIPKLGTITFGRLVPVGLDGTFGNPWDFTLQPNNAAPSISHPVQTVAASGLTVDLAFDVQDPAGLGGTLYVWTNHSSANDADSALDWEGSLVIADTVTPFTADQADVFTLFGGGTSTLLNDITVHAGKGKRVFAEFVNSEGTSSGIQTILLLPGKPPVTSTGTLVPDIVDTQAIAALAVTAAKIGAAAVEAGKIAANAVTATEIANLAVTTAKIADLGVTAAKIGAAAVEEAKIAAGAVVEAKIGAQAVTTAKLANLAVTDAILAAGAVTTTKITDDAVTTPKIVAGAIVTSKIAAGAVTANEIAANTIVAGNIAAGTITGTEIAAVTITGNKLVANTITAAQIAAGTITATELAAGSVTASKIGAGEVTAGKIAALSITGAEIAAGAITAAKITAGTITSAEIAAGTITAANIASATITSGEIAALTINAGNIASNAITAAKIAAGTITAAQIASGTITSNEIAALTINASNIAGGAITASKISVSTLSAVAAEMGSLVMTYGTSSLAFKYTSTNVGAIDATYTAISNQQGIRLVAYDSDGSLRAATWTSGTGSYIGYGEFSVGGSISATQAIYAAASNASRPSLRIPHGTAPSSPADGDIWTTTAGLFVRINGSTIGPLS